MAPSKVRLAVMGDSWVSSWLDDWKLDSSLPNGMAAGLSANAVAGVELIVAGFPGFTAERLLMLAQMCRLRDMARVYDKKDGHLPMRGDFKRPLLDAGVPILRPDTMAGEVDEDVDVVVIVAGYNDFSHDDASADKVFRTMTQLKDLYIARGVDAIIVTIGEGRAEFEERRQLVNKWLVEDCAAVDCDSLLQKLGNEAWGNMEHLTEEACWTLGLLLADPVSQRISKQRQLRTRRSYIGRDSRRGKDAFTPCFNVLRKQRRVSSLCGAKKRQRTIACDWLGTSLQSELFSKM